MSSGGQGSHQLAAMARADGLVVLPDGDGVAAGDAVDVILLGRAGDRGTAGLISDRAAAMPHYAGRR